jgi:SAM-dependent methyltransferase
MRIIEKYLETLYEKALELNHRNIFSLLEKNQNAFFLDLGCDDGKSTLKIAETIDTKNIYGVDIVDERIELAKENGVIVKKFDLNYKFEFDDNYFDVIVADQIIEHLYNLDNFISEIYRILRPSGYVIVSTENASSWCNIFANIMGWQSFSATNISDKKQGIGNPLALHRNEVMSLKSWKHINIYSILGIKEFFEMYGFKFIKLKGAGYFPLSGSFGNIDKTHSHFIVFKFVK